MFPDPFDSRPREYDAWYDENPEVFRQELELIRDWVKGFPSLEIGAGTGRFASALSFGFALDKAKGALQLAKERGVIPVLGDAGLLPFRGGLFATAGIFFSLEFFSEPARVIAECHRVLAPAGRLLILHILLDSARGHEITQKKCQGFYAGMVQLYCIQDVRVMASGFRAVDQRERDGLSALLFERA